MARQGDRFVKVYSQGSSFTAIVQIWVDRETGVNYLWQSSGYGGGLTPLLKPDGTRERVGKKPSPAGGIAQPA